MNTILAVTLFGLIQAQAYMPLQASTSPVIERKVDNVSSTTIKDKIVEIAQKYSVNAYQIDKVIACESNYNPRAVGDNGKSFGLVQIYQPAHPSVTKEQAFDIDFALDFIASEFAKGNQNLWTCWRTYFGIK